MTTQELRAAIENLYDVFAGYPLREWTDPCAHCHTADDERKIHAAPLRELTPADLHLYAWNALLLWGDAADFKHFLPRLFELVSDGVIAEYCDTEVIYGHLAHAEFAGWPDHEKAAVRRFASADLTEVLAECVGIGAVDEVLTGIMRFEDDLTPYLSKWELSEDPNTRANVVEFARRMSEIAAGRKHWNAFADKDLPGRAQAMTWGQRMFQSRVPSSTFGV